MFLPISTKAFFPQCLMGSWSHLRKQDAPMTTMMTVFFMIRRGVIVPVVVRVVEISLAQNAKAEKIGVVAIVLHDGVGYYYYLLG